MIAAHPAVDHEVVPIDVARVIAEEKGYRIGDVLGDRDPADGDDASRAAATSLFA